MKLYKNFIVYTERLEV